MSDNIIESRSVVVTRFIGPPFGGCPVGYQINALAIPGRENSHVQLTAAEAECVALGILEDLHNADCRHGPHHPGEHT